MNSIHIKKVLTQRIKYFHGVYPIGLSHLQLQNRL